MTAAVAGPPTPPTSVDTRQRVLETALRMFGERGYAATSFRDIALELGLTKAAVYYHFPSKEGLVTALVEPLFDSFDAVLASPDLAPRELLAGLQQAVFESGPVMSVLANDPSLVEAGAVIQKRAKGLVVRCSKMLAGPHPSRAKLARAMPCSAPLRRDARPGDAHARRGTDAPRSGGHPRCRPRRAGVLTRPDLLGAL